MPFITDSLFIFGSGFAGVLGLFGSDLFVYNEDLGAAGGNGLGKLVYAPLNGVAFGSFGELKSAVVDGPALAGLGEDHIVLGFFGGFLGGILSHFFYSFLFCGFLGLLGRFCLKYTINAQPPQK